MSHKVIAPDQSLPAQNRIWYLLVAAISTLLIGGAVYFASDGNFLFVGLIAILLLACVSVLIDQRSLVFVALIGAPTVFVFASNALSAIPFVTVERLIFVLLFVPLILGTIYRRRLETPLMMMERFIIVFIFLIIASLAMGLPSRPTEQWGPDISFFFQGYLMPLAGFILVRRMAWTAESMQRIFIAFAAIGAACGIVASIFIVTGVNIVEPTWIELNREHAERATGPFANPTEFGGVCLMGLISAVWLVKSSKGWTTLILAAAITLSLAGILLSQTRAVWLATAVSIFLLAYFDRRILKLVLGPAIVGMIAAAILAPFVLGSAQFQERLGELSPIYNRLTSLTTAGNVIADHAVTGVGFGKDTFELAKPGRYADFAGVSGSYAVDLGPPHNEWIHVTAMLGIPTGILYIIIWALLGRLLWRMAYAESRGTGRAIGSAPIFVIFSVTVLYTLVVDIGFFEYVPFATWFLAAIAIKASESET